MKTTLFRCGECKNERTTRGRVGETCADCFRRNAPRGGVEVGQRFGRLLVTKVRPFLMLCDCGNVVTDRKPYHVTHNKLKSCGCGFRNKVRAHNDNRWSAIEVLNPDDKARFQKFRVHCVRCAGESIVGYESVKQSKPFTEGCRLCVKAKQERLRRERDEKAMARASRKAVAECL